jgi:hypothetical protein
MLYFEPFLTGYNSNNKCNIRIENNNINPYSSSLFFPTLYIKNLYQIISYAGSSSYDESYIIKDVSYNEHTNIDQTIKLIINKIYTIKNVKQFFYCYNSLGDPV